MAEPNATSRCGMLRSQVRPGDVMLKLNTSGLIPGVISKTTHSEYVHGGIGGEGGTIYDVNGGLPDDQISGKRLLPNVYRSSLQQDNQMKTAYRVWRCTNVPIVDIVHREAAPFVAVGTNSRWRYNFHVVTRVVGAIVGSATNKVFTHKKNREIDEQKLNIERLVVSNGGSFIDAAKQTNRDFFCTEWIVWMYLLASYKAAQEGHRQSLQLNIRPYEAIPNNLAQALINSPDFTLMGNIGSI